MEKVIYLGEKELKLHSSLFTIIDYKNVFGTELFNDIKKIEKISRAPEDDFSVIIDTIFKIIYILNRPYSKQSYQNFLMNVDFSLLNDSTQLENLSNAIGELLGSIKKGGTTSPQSK